MRALLGCILAWSLAISPALGGASGPEESAAVTNSKSSTAAKYAVPVTPAATAANPKRSSLESEFEELRSLLESQGRQIEEQNKRLREQQQRMQVLEEQLKMTKSDGEKLSAEPMVGAAGNASPNGVLARAAAASPSVTAAPAPRPALLAQTISGTEETAPLQLRIGNAYITPVGFMDLTGVYRTHTGGSGIGTNFASIPFGNVFQNHLGEFRLNMQNSRIGFRADAIVMGAHVIGYMESDFLGNNPGNVSVSSNSNTMRSRLYWVDVQKGKWEVLGGQTWSLITPGRSGISPLPGNLFFTQNIDVNYQLGLVWGRIPELRLVYRPTDKLAFAIALDSPEQYIGGSAGGSGVTLPALLNTTTTYGGELNNGGTGLSTPNVAPDIIVKVAFDPSNRIHIEGGGVERQFRVWNPNNGNHYSATGAGAFLNLNVQLFNGFRIVTNNFWSSGGGRYIFGQAPDLIARADGSISAIHAGSTVSGLEYTRRNTLLYAYYGGLYIQRNRAFDTNGTTPIGYGYAGSPSSQNRAVQEATIGFNQTLWRDGKFGALNFMGQYSYLVRTPWFVASGSPSNSSLNMLFVNLRYTLPGSAPTLR